MPIAANSDGGLVGAHPEFYAHTKSDSANATKPFRYIWVGTGGDVNVVKMDDSTCVIPSVPNATLIYAPGKRINSTSTTASGFVTYV